MKLSSDEGRAIAFVLGLIGLAAAARVATRPKQADIPVAAALDATALQDSSEQALKVARARAKSLAADERIDVNSASSQELDRLPGVGPGLAARIVEERQRGGAFDSAADLRSVRGIGPALLAKLEPHLAFEVAGGLPRRRAANVALDGNGDGVPRDRGHVGPARSSGPIDLNRATAADLEALPGVGPALAARIVAKRDSLNGFGKIDDLKKVRGIGPATLERLRGFFRS